MIAKVYEGERREREREREMRSNIKCGRSRWQEMRVDDKLTALRMAWRRMLVNQEDCRSVLYWPRAIFLPPATAVFFCFQLLPL